MGDKKRKIVFLGSDLSPISLGCLHELASGNRYELLIGIEQRNESAWGLLKTTWRRHGMGGLARRLARVCFAKGKMLMRRAGPDVCDARCLHEVAELTGTRTFASANINNAQERQILKDFDPDLIVVANFSQIIRAPVREIPKLGIINFHPSLLPKYRGPAPWFWILKDQEQKSGVTVHHIDSGIDSGDIILQRELTVRPHETEKTLITRSVEIGAPLLARSVELLIAGTSQRTNQEESESTYFGFPNSD